MDERLEDEHLFKSRASISWNSSRLRFKKRPAWTTTERYKLLVAQYDAVAEHNAVAQNHAVANQDTVGDQNAFIEQICINHSRFLFLSIEDELLGSEGLEDSRVSKEKSKLISVRNNPMRNNQHRQGRYDLTNRVLSRRPANTRVNKTKTQAGRT